MICQFKRLIYPKAVTAGDASYMIALYRPCEKVMDAAGNVVSEIKAVGYCLPTADNLRYDMRGRWSRSAKHGIQFEVEGFDEVIVPSKEGVIAYLCSGQIKGIGPKTAEKIYAMFGQNTLTVLDHEPEQLLAVSGISKTKLKKICDSYLASRGARDVVAFLAPHGVTPNRAVKLYKQYGEHTMDIVRNHPYRLCEMVGIGFKTADRIAVSMGFDPLSPERVDEGLIFTLTDAELKGHLCMEKHSFLKQCLKLLDTEGLTEEMLAVRASRMLESGRLASYDRQVYRAVTARTEQSLAWAVYRMLTYEKAGSHVNIDTEISAEEKKQGIQLASEQRHAVTTALTSQLSVITGGPGTGKTLIQRFLLDIYRRKNRGAKIICCAPTGRAARRMEQSTGFPATTIHKALGLLAGEDGDYCEPEMLDADLIVVDEVSMMDIYLANHLFRSVPHGSQLVLIGDADQLLRVLDLIVAAFLGLVQGVHDLAAMVGVRSRAAGGEPQIVTADDTMYVAAADAPGGLLGDAARAHGADTAASAGFAEAAMGGLVLDPLLPGVSANLTAVFQQRVGSLLHLLNSCQISPILQSDFLLII